MAGLRSRPSSTSISNRCPKVRSAGCTPWHPRNTMLCKMSLSSDGIDSLLETFRRDREEPCQRGTPFDSLRYTTVYSVKLASQTISMHTHHEGRSCASNQLYFT